MSSILVTGATGTFGNAFVRRLLKADGYERICILSRDELKQSQMRAALDDDARLRWFIGDVRDEARLVQAFDGVDVVVHAAALKQVPTCEYNPREAVLTNVQGAMNVITAAVACRVKRVIALSSDKAVAPVNTYGKCKALMESLVTQANVYSHATRFACVRYGNVFGSRGSVIPLWEEQLADTGRIRITDPAMTRFFMTIDEACQLVEDALRAMVGGEIFVPKTRSMAMVDLARAWYANKHRFAAGDEDRIDLSNQFQVVGIRPGEKLHETLVSEHESYRTLDQADRFVILPVAREWVSEEIAGRPLAAGRAYTSDDNEWMLDVKGIREWLNELH